MTTRPLTVSTEVDASKSAVWEAWTTPEGIRSFFAPACTVDITPLGAYEIFFDPDAPPGQRGAEENVVLAVQPETMLSFTWNFPKEFESLQDQRTAVAVRIADAGPERTTVTVTQTGWGVGDVWEEAREYFRDAWGEVVLARLQRRFAEESVPPQEEP